MNLPNPDGQFPKISDKAWIFETALIIGDVTIEDNVFVGPNAVIRADEPGSSILICSGCNVQDNVVIHSLSSSEVRIGSNTSLAHSCIVHGPCQIEENCFIGFGAVVFDCSIGRDSLVLHRSVVRGVEIAEEKVVPDGAIITNPELANALEGLTKELADFKESVVRANIELVKGYTSLQIVTDDILSTTYQDEIGEDQTLGEYKL